MKNFKDIESMVLGLFEKRGWVKWIHEGTRRAYTSEEKKANANLANAKLVDHCAKCMNMNGCCFPANNSPQPPLHPNCHCWLMPVQYIEFSANCSEEKFKIYTLRFQKKMIKANCFQAGDMV